MVDEPVDHGGGDGVVAEDLTPAGEVLVAGDDEAGAFVAGLDELEEQVGGLWFEGDVADLVDDQHWVADQATEFVLEFAGVVGFGKPIDPLTGGGELDSVAGLASADRQPGGEVGLAGAGRTEQDDVLLGGDEVQGAQVCDGLPLQAAGVVVVVLQALAGGEPGGADPPLAAVGLTGRDLALQAGGEELLMGPGLLPGSFGQPLDRVAQRRCFNARVRNSSSEVTSRPVLTAAVRGVVVRVAIR